MYKIFSRFLFIVFLFFSGFAEAADKSEEKFYDFLEKDINKLILTKNWDL